MSFITDIFSAQTAAKGQQKAADAASKAAADSLAEQKRQFDTSTNALKPYQTAGVGALNVLSQTAGLNGPAVGYNWNRYLTDNPDVADAIAKGGFGGVNGEGGAAGAAQRHYQEYGTSGGHVAPVQATNLDAFTASPDYNFRLNEGARALTARNSALGIQDSGAAQKSALTYSQNLASGEYGDWWNRLSGLAGTGQTATNTSAQLGSNFANALTGINQTKANALGSSYINQGNIWGNYLSDLGGKADKAISAFLPIPGK